MNCDDFKAKCHNYYLGRLDAVQEEEMRGHAAACRDCGELMRLADELPCRDFIAFLDEYLGNELSSERRAVFERHLKICRDCTRYLAAYQNTVQLSRQACMDPALEAQPIPAELLAAVLAARKRAK